MGVTLCAFSSLSDAGSSRKSCYLVAVPCPVCAAEKADIIFAVANDYDEREGGLAGNFSGCFDDGCKPEYVYVSRLALRLYIFEIPTIQLHRDFFAVQLNDT